MSHEKKSSKLAKTKKNKENECIFHFIGSFSCCETLNVLFENDVKDKWGKFEGVYTFQGFSDGMDFWVDAEGEHAIWYLASGSVYHWMIGSLVNLGSNTSTIYSSSNTLEKQCPNNEGGNVWDWFYDPDGSSFIATNDVYMKCANEDDKCTSEDQCGTNEGDCDTHDECYDGLLCGSNNCKEFWEDDKGEHAIWYTFGYHPELDSCYAPTVRDEDSLFSPNYPKRYPIYEVETWLLRAPTGSFITLQFTHFDVRLIVESKIKPEYKFQFSLS